MKKRLRWIGALLLIGIAAGAWLARTYLWSATPYVDPQGTDIAHGVPPLIATTQPVIRSISSEIPWIGFVESQASVELVALVEGRVESIEAEDQMPIEAEAMVMRLGGPQIELRRQQLQADIESLNSQLSIAEQTVQRRQKLLKERLSTDDQFAAAQEAELKIRAELRDAQLALDSFEKQTLIVGPVAGVFTNRRVSQGQTVNAGDVVGEIIDQDHLRIVASVFPPEHVALQDKEATIRHDESEHLTGTVRRVLPEAGGTGATTLWIEGPEIDGQLHPGQTVGGNIVIEVKPETLVVPESAIVYDTDERPYVFVPKDRDYEPRRVQLGMMQEGWVEVISGLDPNETVVTQGAYELFYRRFNEQYKVQD